MMMDFYFQKMTNYYESNIKDLLKKIREKDIWYQNEINKKEI